MSRTEVPELAEFEDPFLVSSRRSQSGSQAPDEEEKKVPIFYFEFQSIVSKYVSPCFSRVLPRVGALNFCCALCTKEPASGEGGAQEGRQRERKGRRPLDLVVRGKYILMEYDKSRGDVPHGKQDSG